MAIYTGIADTNGDFIVPFSSAYAAGQKIIVTAEKDLAQKTIELFAPSDTASKPFMQISGDISSFPENIGRVTISGINSIPVSAFGIDSGATKLFLYKSTGLLLRDCNLLGDSAFHNWGMATSLEFENCRFTSVPDRCFNTWTKLLACNVPDSVVSIGTSSFGSMIACKSVSLPSTLQNIGATAFSNMSNCDFITCLATTPPTITSNTFVNLNPGCIFKVPAGSVAAYQTATNWSAFAARIQAI